MGEKEAMRLSLVELAAASAPFTFEAEAGSSTTAPFHATDAYQCLFLNARQNATAGLVISVSV